MGQQQLLLIVLGVIIVGIAVLVGMLLFRQNSIEEKRDLVINESLHIAQYGQEYYLKPTPRLVVVIILLPVGKFRLNLVLVQMEVIRQ